jgi:ssDNA-binding Zn-finger/Zn-ribbon topoisomerase 1
MKFLTEESKMKCPDCGSNMEKRYGKFGKFWACVNYPECDCCISTKLNRTPANKELRQLRKQAHEAFDIIWRSGMMGRSEAYVWLGNKMGLPRHETHIGLFDKRKCAYSVEICHKYMPNDFYTW